MIKKKKKIEPLYFENLKSLLLELKEAIDGKNKEKANLLTKQVLSQANLHIKKGLFDFFNDFVLGIGFVLLLVALINQLWFQLYQIPSGSMRPTVLEKDRLVATKSNFGINFPFKTKHLYFNNDSLTRGNIVIFSSDRLPMEDRKSRYLFIFPAKKQMIKRLIGKPGDTLYFYGGQIYGIDKDGNEITEFLKSEAFQGKEHIPFISFEGKVVSNLEDSSSKQIHSPVYLYQMDQLVAKLYVNQNGSYQGKFCNGTQWIDESPNLGYKDLWGMKNFAMTRILSRQEAKDLGHNLENLTDDYFLELSHSPHVNYPKPHLGLDLQGRLRPMITTEKSLIGLNRCHFDKIKEAMQTSRFVIKGGFAGNYYIDKSFKPHQYSPYFKDLPDGTYEFINGIAYQINSRGVQTKLRADHPLNSLEPKDIQRFFNLGIHMVSLFEPGQSHDDFLPPRYAYFRNGNLHVMGAPIFLKTDVQLVSFNKLEKEKTHAFVDHGAPLINGKLNKDLIINYGLTIPPKSYLLLGDNHAGSRDCRDFGFIPEENIQGAPAAVFWPPSSRIGFLSQNQFNYFNLSNVIIWSSAFLAIGYSILYSRKNRNKQL